MNEPIETLNINADALLEKFERGEVKVAHGEAASENPNPTKTWSECIRCPECRAEQWALIEHEYGMPFARYIYNCHTCGHTILESEWERVDGGEVEPKGGCMIIASRKDEIGTQLLNELAAASARIAELEIQLKLAQEKIASRDEWIERMPKLAAEAAELESKRLRVVVNRIADQVGRPRVAPGEIGIESVAEAVERHVAYSRSREETLDSITPENLRAFAASEAHHDEHHERERELEARLKEAEARVQNVRILNDEMNGRLADLLEAYEQVVEGNRTLLQRAEKAEARLKEANEIIDANRWPDTAAKILRETQAALDDTKRFANIFARDWKAAEARADAAEKEYHKAQAEIDRVVENGIADTEEEKQRRLKAEADAGRLRAALEMVEWHDNSGRGHSTKTAWLQCPWCLKYKGDGHKKNCQRQAALHPATPESGVKE